MNRSTRDLIPWLRGAFWCALLASFALFLIWTWRWPLVGDSSLIHYICFLMDHGMAPYRTVSDMNMPGSFLIEWAAMHIYGGGSLAWRCFDLTVVAVAAAGILAVARPYDRLAGVFAAVLFALIHARDGINDTGQRDFTMAALTIVGYACLFRVLRRNTNTPAFLFGFFVAAAGTIKPTALPLGVMLLILLAAALRAQGRGLRKPLLLGSAGFLTPLAICWIFLLREHALSAFLHGLFTVVPYFASLGRRPWQFLLLHSISPLLPLVAIWLVLILGSAAADRSWDRWLHPRTQPWPVETWERTALLIGGFVMLGGFLAQGKGFPYHRYPVLVLLLPLIAIDLTRALRRSGYRLALGIAGLAFGSLILAPQSAFMIHRYDWRNQEFITMLQADLSRLGGPALSGRVQCLDTISGCATTLYRMRLLPASGLISDFLVFGPPGVPAVGDAREAFRAAVAAGPPAVLIVTSNLFPSGPGDFQKLSRWPWLQNFIEGHYRLWAQRTPPHLLRWWSRVQQPASYRIYILNSGPLQFASSAAGGR